MEIDKNMSETDSNEGSISSSKDSLASKASNVINSPVNMRYKSRKDANDEKKVRKRTTVNIYTELLKLLEKDRTERSRHQVIVMDRLINMLGMNVFAKLSIPVRHKFFKLVQLIRIDQSQVIYSGEGKLDFWVYILSGKINIKAGGEFKTLGQNDIISCDENFLGTVFENVESIVCGEDCLAELMMMSAEDVATVVAKANQNKSLDRRSFSRAISILDSDQYTSVTDLNEKTLIDNILWVDDEKSFYCAFVGCYKTAIEKFDDMFTTFRNWLESASKDEPCSIIQHMAYLFFAWILVSPSDLSRFDGQLEECICMLWQALNRYKGKTILNTKCELASAVFESMVANTTDASDLNEYTLDLNDFKEQGSDEFRWTRFENEKNPHLNAVFIIGIKQNSHMFRKGFRVGTEIIAVNHFCPKKTPINTLNEWLFKNATANSKITQSIVHGKLNFARFIDCIYAFKMETLMPYYNFYSTMKNQLFEKDFLTKIINKNAAQLSDHDVKKEQASSPVFVENTAEFERNSFLLYVGKLEEVRVLLTENLNLKRLKKCISYLAESKNIELPKNMQIWKAGLEQKDIVYRKLVGPMSVNDPLVSSNKINVYREPIVMGTEEITQSKPLYSWMHEYKRRNVNFQHNSELFIEIDFEDLNMKYLAVELTLLRYEAFKDCRFSEIVVAHIYKKDELKVDKKFTYFKGLSQYEIVWIEAVLLKAQKTKSLKNVVRQLFKLLAYLYKFINYNTLVNVAMAIKNFESRYNSPKFKKLLSAYKKPFELYSSIYNSQRNFSEYHSLLLSHNIVHPIIPFFIVHTSEFESMVPILQHKKEDGSMSLNIETIKRTSDYILKIVMFQFKGYNFFKMLSDNFNDKKGLFFTKKESEFDQFDIWKSVFYVRHQIGHTISNYENYDTLENGSDDTMTSYSTFKRNASFITTDENGNDAPDQLHKFDENSSPFAEPA